MLLYQDYLEKIAMSFQEKLLEGKYNYYQKDLLYCEEFFKVLREDKSQGNFTFSSEILSRVETGEFLKIFVDYELSPNFDPLDVRVKRSLGAKKSTERFTCDQKNKMVYYSFEGPNGTEEYEKSINTRYQVMTPAFVASALSTEMKKIDPVQRTAYTILTSPNIWEYEEPFRETLIHIENMKLEPVSIKINKRELQATWVNFYMNDKIEDANEKGSEFYLSKHFSIPYMAIHPGDIKIEIQKLKNFESNYSKMF